MFCINSVHSYIVKCNLRLHFFGGCQKVTKEKKKGTKLSFDQLWASFIIKQAHSIINNTLLNPFLLLL